MSILVLFLLQMHWSYCQRTMLSPTTNPLYLFFFPKHFFALLSSSLYSSFSYKFTEHALMVVLHEAQRRFDILIIISYHFVFPFIALTKVVFLHLCVDLLISIFLILLEISETQSPYYFCLPIISPMSNTDTDKNRTINI